MTIEAEAKELYEAFYKTTREAYGSEIPLFDFDKITPFEKKTWLLLAEKHRQWRKEE